jgi:hypothetical protein
MAGDEEVEDLLIGCQLMLILGRAWEAQPRGRMLGEMRGSWIHGFQVKDLPCVSQRWILLPSAMLPCTSCRRVHVNL